MSNENRIIGGETSSDRVRGASYVLRTAAGLLVRVTPEMYRQAMDMDVCHLRMYLSTDPGPDEDAVVVADVIELESRLERVKKEAAALAKKLTEIAS